MELTFVPGQIPEETILEVRLDAPAIEAAHKKLVAWIDGTYERFTRSGTLMGRSLGEYHEAGGWADLDKGPVEVDMEAGCVRFVFYNEPEGEDRLDGGHPDWTSARDTLWLDALPRVREFLELAA